MTRPDDGLRARFAALIAKPPTWLVVAAVLAWSAVALFWSSRRPPLDFPSFRFAASTAWGAGASPYDAGVRAVASAARGAEILPFVYPPTALLLLAPLALGSAAQSFSALTALNLLLVALLVFLGGRRFSPPARPGAAVWWTLAWYPALLTVTLGQVNLLVVVPLVLAWMCAGPVSSAGGGAGAERALGPRATLAGLLFALAIGLKVYAAIFLLWMLARRRWRLLGSTMGWLMALVAVSIATLPATLWIAWLVDVVGGGATGGSVGARISLLHQANLAPVGTFGRAAQAVMGDAEIGKQVGLVLGGLTSLAVLARTLVPMWRAPRQPSGDLDFAAVLLAMLLAAPLTWEHHLVAALPAALAISASILQPGAHRPTVVATLLALAVLAVPTAVVSPMTGLDSTGVLHGYKGVAVFALWWLSLRSEGCQVC